MTRYFQSNKTLELLESIVDGARNANDKVKQLMEKTKEGFEAVVSWSSLNFNERFLA